MRKYTTAFTLTDTLSRVITSCGGTSMTTVRRSMRTICCTTGMSRKKPGPLTFQNRPEHEHDRALVLAQDAERHRDEQQDDDGERSQTVFHDHALGSSVGVGDGHTDKRDRSAP